MKRFLLTRLLPAGVFVGFALMALSLVLLRRNLSVAKLDGDPAEVHSQKGVDYLQQHLYRAAIDEFETASRKSPRALDPWLGLAAVYIRLGDGPHALEGAGKAATIARDSAPVQILLGRAHWLAGNIVEAEKAGVAVRDLDHNNLEAAELLLNVYFHKHDWKKFEEIFDSVEHPNRAITDLGVQAAIQRGEFAKAYAMQTDFDRRDLESETLRTELTMRREPGRTDLYPLLIRNLVRLGRSADAIAARRQYSGPTPLDLEMGNAYSLAGNREEAIRAYERASAGVEHKLSAEVALAVLTGDHRHWIEAFRAERVEKDYFVLSQLEEKMETATPLDKAYIHRYAAIFDPDLYNRAADQALAILRVEPEDFESLMILGTAYARLGKTDDAIRYVRQGADRHPERAEVWSRLGQLQLAKGDLNSAAPLMEKAISLESSNASYLYNYGWLLDQLDRDKEAVPFYERAIAASSFSHEAMNNLALIEAAAGRGDRAVALLNRAVSSNPENEAAYFNRGNYHASQRAWKEALADYARATELNPLTGYSALQSARVHIELNRADIAIDELDAALDINPNLREAYELLSAAYKKRGRERESAAALAEAKRIKDPQ